MDNQIVAEVTEWGSRPFSGGYAGLEGLADEEFTGAVTNGTAWLFLLNGRVVGAVDGSIDAFESADGTAYEAPHPSVPLLFAMQERGGETKAKYYTEETPLSDVDRTLSSGNFTGYVELSENVLSGDYYVVYHGGRSLACAFIGNNRTLLTGDEALDRADGEVGIYEVYDVDVDVIPIPDGDGGAEGAAAAAESGNEIGSGNGESTGTDDAGPATGDGLEGHVSDELDGVGGIGGPSVGGDAESGPSAVDDPADDGPIGTVSGDDPGASVADTASDAEDEQTAEALNDDADSSVVGAGTDGDEQPSTNADEQSSTGVDATATDASETETDASETAAEAGDRGDDPRGQSTETDDPAEGVEGAETASVGSTETEPVGDAGEDTDERTDAPASGDSEDPFSEEAQWRETQSIPSLDPSNSEPQARTAVSEREAEPAAGDETTGTTARQSRSEPAVEQSETAESAAPGGVPDEEEVATLREQLRELEAAKEEAEAAKERLAVEREELQAERDEYRQRAQQLESRVEDLEAEIKRLERAVEDADGRDDGPGTRTMAAAEALTGTNLFVRYDTKGGATLEKGHAGEFEREAVVENLSLEHHTSFDTDGLRVAGDPFETFLENTVEYRFVRWVVEDLLYEIRNTGHEAQLQELFDSIPEIDRAELDGTVSVEFEENGEPHREQEQFDVVLRDRMGNPLIVANLNAARDPASGEMMTDLIETARRVKDTSDTLGSAFLVTTSYFQPDALETADDATGGGLLGRGKRKSFVKLSRKRGFHLCLVETRDGNFHVNVPEL